MRTLLFYTPLTAIISAQRLTKLFSGKALFSDLSLGIDEGERLGILGANGAGKSTLLKIIAGKMAADDGEVVTRRDLRISYVAQDDVFGEGDTVYSVLEKELLASGLPNQGTIPKLMSTIGFPEKETVVTTLSGGWRKRLSLARGLISEPDVLLLDEPTNHLDIETIEWLEGFVGGLRCAVVFISHDRYFIEAVATRVIELDRRYPNGYISNFGNYSSFIEYRADFLSQLRQQRDTLANRVRREVQWLRQGAKARTTKSKHRTAEANRMIEELKSISLSDKRTSVEFAAGGKRSKELLKAEKIEKSLGGRLLFSNLDVLLSPGSRLGIVGANGSGKSTLLKVLLSKLEADKGKVTLAINTKVAFFDQARKNLDLKMTLKQALMGDRVSIVFNGVEHVAVAWAKRFLFSPEQLAVTLQSLSGGEQARVLIAQMMCQPADILILDEPTNDLDISTLEVLEESLEEFPGAIVLVTHDRYLLDRLSTQIIGLLGEGQTAMFASYLQWEMAKEAQPSRFSGRTELAVGNMVGGLSQGEHVELAAMEAKIKDAEAVVAKFEKQLADPDVQNDGDLLDAAVSGLTAAHEEVDKLFARWEDLEQRHKAA